MALAAKPPAEILEEVMQRCSGWHDPVVPMMSCTDPGIIWAHPLYVSPHLISTGLSFFDFENPDWNGCRLHISMTHHNDSSGYTTLHSPSRSTTRVHSPHQWSSFGSREPAIPPFFFADALFAVAISI